MNLKIICLGKLKEKYLTDAIQEYSKRISKYANLEIIQLPDEVIPESPSLKEINIIKDKEADKILKHIKPNEFVCSLDLKGKQLSSEEFANKLQDITLKGHGTIDFIIGGTVGLSEKILEKSDFLISFSKLTFPHQLIRLFLTEQLFRCFKILNNEKYHW